MVSTGLRQTSSGIASPPYSRGPYTWDQHVTFTAGATAVNTNKKVYFVDGDNGSDGNDGKSWTRAFATIQAALDACAQGDTVFVAPKAITDTTGDPTSYAETLTIDVASVSLIGLSRGRSQGGLPQIRKGSGTTAQITVQAPGCYIAGLGINGASATGGGILLDDDYSTKSAFGTTIEGCHIKNCKVTSTNAATGGGIMWTSAGNAWQVLIRGNRFYRCAGDITMLGTSNTVPQDVVIEDNVFSGPADVTDCNIYTAADGINGLIIRNNDFTAFPAVGSGTNVTFLVLTGSVGLLSGNRFASTGKTFGAAANVKVPTTMFMADNYQEDGTTQIART